MDDNEVIAVLVAGYDDDDGAGRATVILRDGAGNVSMKHMSTQDGLAQRAANIDRFRRGKPIVDPVSREVVGYELERVAMPR